MVRRVIGVLPEDFVIPGGEAELVLPLAPDRAYSSMRSGLVSEKCLRQNGHK